MVATMSFKEVLRGHEICRRPFEIQFSGQRNAFEIAEGMNLQRKHGFVVSMASAEALALADTILNAKMTVIT